MEIIINKNKKIFSDNLNWTYCERIKDKKDNYTWKSTWFYPNLEACYFDLLDYFTRESEKETLKEAFLESVDMLKEIRKELKKC
jgi:hypothetical protein